MRPLQKGSFCPQRCSQMLIYYFINCALLLSLRTKNSSFCTRPQVMQNSTYNRRRLINNN